MTNKNSRSTEETAIHKLTYQPFLLAVAFLALLGKFIFSLSTGGPILDWVFVLILILFIVAMGVYVWERSRATRSRHSVSISTGKAKRAKIVGIKTDVTPPDEESVTIKTKDISETEVKGIEREWKRKSRR